MGRKSERAGAAIKAPESKQITLPERVCMDVASQHPSVFQLIDLVRQHPERLGLPGRWAPWCFAPVNTVAGVLAKIHEDRFRIEEAEMVLGRATRLAAACAGWRMTKSVYVFDEEVLRSLVDSEVRDGLPDELFLRLPDWAPYIAAPGMRLLNGMVLHGFFVMVDDHDFASAKRYPPELCFSLLLDPQRSTDEAVMMAAMTDPDLMAEVGQEAENGREAMLAVARAREYIHASFNVDLGMGSFKSGLSTGLERSEESSQQWDKLVDIPEQGVATDPSRVGFVTQMAIADALREDIAGAPQGEREKVYGEVTRMLLKLASATLYLCSEEPDIEPKGFRKSRQNAMDEEKRLRKSLQAKRITKWDVGFRIGAEIKRWKEAQESLGEGDGNGASMRPHVRRAHWHTFVSGPRDDKAKQIRRARWLPPIPVNTSGADDLVPTMKTVRGD